MTMTHSAGRNGPRTREQRVRELLRRAKSGATDKYGIGGLRKSASKMPKPVTLPKIGGDGETVRVGKYIADYSTLTDAEKAAQTGAEELLKNSVERK